MINHKDQSLPTIAIYSLTGCAGELLTILDYVDRLLPYVQIISFPFAQSKNEDRPCDIALVEGSVSQKHDLDLLNKIRSQARWLVAMGNCAVNGCVQKGGCNKFTPESMAQDVYGGKTELELLPASGLSKYVRVDVSLPGCPINGEQLLPVLASLLKDHLPYVTEKPLCIECKLNENPCVLIEKNLPCLGPIIASGCGALCPSVGAACYGCFGPCKEPRVEAMSTILMEKGYELDEVMSRLQAFGAPKELFVRIKQDMS